MMKCLSSILLVLLVVTSCGNDQGDPRFVIRGETFFDIPADLSTFGTQFLTISKQPTFIESLLTQNNLSREDVTSVLPAIATIRARNSSVEFDFINAISVRAVSRTDPSNNLEMFYLSFVEFNEDNEMRLLPSIANLSSIMLDEQYDIELRLDLRRFPPTNFICDLTFELDVFVD
jgi:hypothetical protein